MDYESLYKQIPKEPKKWTIADVSTWLTFIGLTNLKDVFASNSIDGSCLGLIEEKELEEDLQITHKIVRKKLVNWIKTGLIEFTAYAKKQDSQMMIEEAPQEIQQMKKQVSLVEEIPGERMIDNMEMTNEAVRGAYRSYSENQNICDLMTNYMKPEAQFQHPIMIQSQHFQQPLTEIQQQPPQRPSQNFMQEEKKIVQVGAIQRDEILGNLEKLIEPKTENELIIKPTEGPQTNFYCINETGGKIGRHSSNQILILEESISRFHAEILFQDGQFYLRDIGSTTGTFIKIESKIQLEVGMMIELGSNQFEVDGIVYLNNQNVEVQFSIIEGPNTPDKPKIKITPQKSISIGRKVNAELSFPDDHHLSNSHAKICLIDGKVYLEEMSSTNGSWLRLSKEGQPSNNQLLDNGTVFKIGTTSTYTCKRQQQVVQEIAPDNCCIICCSNDRDAVYLPCKHNTACLKCSRGIKDCPICRSKIEDIIRIYKN